MIPRQVLHLILVASVLTPAAGCGKLQGPPGQGGVGVRIGPGAAPKTVKPQRDPVQTVKNGGFYDNQHTIGGAIDRGCDMATWASPHPDSGNHQVECQGTWRATGQGVVIHWDVMANGQVKVRDCTLGGDKFSAYDYECLLFPDVSKHDGLQHLQGIWQAISYETEGRAEPDKAKNRKLILAGDRWTLMDDPQATKGTFKHNEKAAPHHIDLLPPGKAESGTMVRAIYTIEGDTLKLCQAPSGKDRPTGFETHAADGRILVVYKQVKPPAG